MKVEIETSSEENSATKLLKRLRFLSFAGLCFAALVLVLYFGKFHGSLSDKADAWGQFGDFIGGTLNPTFSLLALLALLATFTLQIQEFKLSTKELRNSAESLAAQHHAMQRQIFENTFFQLLTLHNQILNSIDLSLKGGNISKGRDCFTVFVKRANQEISAQPSATTDIDSFRIAYSEFQQTYEREVGHYFRTLYNLIKYVDSAEGINARFYTNIVRAQLSSNEVTLLMYNCISEVGFDKFRPLVEKYSLLKGLTELTLSAALIRTVFSPDAFGEFPSLVYPEFGLEMSPAQT